MKKALLLGLVLALALTGCGPAAQSPSGAPSPSAPASPAPSSPAPWPAPVEVASDSLYVEQVAGLPADFILGMDASCVPALERSGVTYYDFTGAETDVYRVLAQNGINYIRVRVWNDPYDARGNGYGGGNCDIDNCVEVGKRATAAGMKLLVDFHYSDFWADPGKQMTPKAWASITDIDEKAAALETYTTQCLTKLVEAGVDVGMVQLGNETNGKLCGESIWMNIWKLMSAGSRAVRAVCPDALIAVHFANPEKADSYASYAKKLDYYQLDYDVFASSYYPYWHGTLDNLAAVLSNIAQTYGKKVMVAETSYAFTTEDTDFSGNTIGEGGGVVKDYPLTVQGQANLVRNVVDTVANKTTNGIGVFYWEGTWISVGGASWEENSALWEKYGSGWASSFAAEYDPGDAGKHYGGCAVDNQAFFDAAGHPLESLKVWGLLRSGNRLEVKADAIADTSLICDLNGDVVLPQTVSAVMTDNSRREVPVTWESIDAAAMKSAGPRVYDVAGVADGMEAHCFVSMVEYNFLSNWSFEDNDDGAPWVAIDLTGKMNELYVEDKITDSITGSKHYHFWSSGAGTVEFTLEQEVADLPAGAYRYAISIMGGDGGAVDIYAYVKVNGVEVGRGTMDMTVYNEWHKGTVDGVRVAAGDTVTCGVYVKCAGAGSGAWGKLDDAMLNSVTGG